MVVGDAGVDLTMEVFDIAGAGCGEIECCIELGKVSGFDGDVEFAEGGEPEAELAAGDAVGFDGLVLDVAFEPVLDSGDEFAVGCPGG